MKFYTAKRPFVGTAPYTYTGENESKSLAELVKRSNEAHAGRGLKFLRSFLSNVVKLPAWAAAKPIYAAVNGKRPSDAVALSRALLSQSYESAESHFVSAQIACLVKKYPFSGDISVRRDNALTKFLRGERRNRHMNALLRRRRVSHESTMYNLQGLGMDPTPFVAVMRKYIQRVIGSNVPFGEIASNCRWGPGAVVGVNGQFTNFARKLLSEAWTVTPAAIPYVLSAAKGYPMFWELLDLQRNVGPELTVTCIDPVEFDKRMLARLVIVQHNKIAFVPKDADCDRTIASEPLMNQFLQLGVDYVMKKRLRIHGLDLSKQAPNQELARQGSVTGWLNSYCTADLKNASGSIYTELIRELLPASWFSFLNAIRSPSWMIDQADPVKYQGFVSMGNGYCFPLETLIFASICSAACTYTGSPEDFRVYGDDIIVRQNESAIVQEYLRYFGFELNPDKSFFFGPFRESCGADWYDGEPVRPVYLDDTLDTFEQRVRAHNALCRLPNRWAEPLAHACRDWFPLFSSKFCNPFAGETDEAVDNRFATILDPWHMRNKTLNVPAWYGMDFRSKLDTEIAERAAFPVAYKYACLSGSNPDKPFAERRETLMSVKRFFHGGGESQDFPHEDGRCDNVQSQSRPRIRIGICGYLS